MLRTISSPGVSAKFFLKSSAARHRAPDNRRDKPDSEKPEAARYFPADLGFTADKCFLSVAIIPTSTDTLRIFLADDHAVVRAGLKALIQQEAKLVVVGEGADGLEVLAQVPGLAPDVVVLDVSMPRMTGTQVAAELRKVCPAVKILALSVHEDRSYLRELLEAGATGYVLKRSAADELIRAIHTVASGSVYVDPAVAGDLVRALVHSAEPSANPALSDRESEVLRLIADGYGTKEVAAQLDISVKTVETYKARSMEKLGLKTRVDIIRYAKQTGWFSN